MSPVNTLMFADKPERLLVTLSKTKRGHAQNKASNSCKLSKPVICLYNYRGLNLILWKIVPLRH